MKQSLVLFSDSKTFRDVVVVISASILLSLCSFVKIPLFFTPVPLVIQNSIAVMLGALLGSKRGVAAVLLFLFYGICHFPVFAGGHGGVPSLLTSGYLLGYCVAAFCTGKLRELYPSQFLIASLVGHLIILFLGTFFLALICGLERACVIGFVPFVLFDVLKAVVVANVVKRLS